MLFWYNFKFTDKLTMFSTRLATNTHNEAESESTLFLDIYVDILQQVTDRPTLLTCRLVCREWNAIIKHMHPAFGHSIQGDAVTLRCNILSLSEQQLFNYG